MEKYKIQFLRLQLFVDRFYERGRHVSPKNPLLKRYGPVARQSSMLKLQCFLCFHLVGIDCMRSSDQFLRRITVLEKLCFSEICIAAKQIKWSMLSIRYFLFPIPSYSFLKSNAVFKLLSFLLWLIRDWWIIR